MIFTDYFEHLLLEAGDVLDFSKFDNKLKNRVSEFEAIRNLLPRKPYYKVLSFPAEYSFERSFYNEFKVPLIVYVMQTNFSVVHAKRFIKDTGDANTVMVPIKTSKGKYYPLKSIRSDDITSDIDVPYAPVNFSRFSVVQNYESLPSKFDLIDLDYMGTFTPRLMGQVGSFYDNKLNSGGLLFVTLNLSGYRDYVASTSKTASDLEIDRDDPTIQKFSIDALKSNDNKSDIVKKDTSYYGITSNSQMYKNMTKNIVSIIKDAINKKPVFINLYRGGISSKGKIMLRLIYKK